MKIFSKLLLSRNLFPLAVVVFFGVLAGRSLIFEPGYFNMHDDLQIMRQFELEKCFLDGQIPCRWVPDMGYGFGFPLFNFYPPLPYIMGELFRIIGFSFVVTAKLTFALSFLLSGIGMYLLAKEFFGRLGGIIAAVFYIWAPYHSVDIYVRGAMNEAWALIFFPFILWSGYRLVRSGSDDQRKWIIALALSYAGLFMSHNLMVIIFTPFFAVWMLIHSLLEGAWKKLPVIILSGLWSLGLSSYFTFPALLENKFTQIKGQLIGYYDYTVHFVSLRQLLATRFWGYGPSVWLEEDGMPFQIGHLHWMLSILIGLIIIYKLLKRDSPLMEKLKNQRVLISVLFFIAMGWVSAFMTHSRSTDIYLMFPQLSYVQFPWRFLTLVILGFSFSAGYVARLFSVRNKFVNAAAYPFKVGFSVLLIMLLVVLNWNYFRPEYGKMGPLTDEEKLSGKAWMLQQTAGIYDYLPVYALEAPKEAQKSVADILAGEGIINGMSQGTYWGKFSADISSEKALVRVNIFKFPGWKIFVDGREVEHTIPDDEKWARMHIELTKGNHLVYAQFYNTPVRTVSNLISLLSWGAIIAYGFRGRSRLGKKAD